MEVAFLDIEFSSNFALPTSLLIMHACSGQVFVLCGWRGSPGLGAFPHDTWATPPVPAPPGPSSQRDFWLQGWVILLGPRRSSVPMRLGGAGAVLSHLPVVWVVGPWVGPPCCLFLPHACSAPPLAFSFSPCCRPAGTGTFRTGLDTKTFQVQIPVVTVREILTLARGAD